MILSSPVGKKYLNNSESLQSSGWISLDINESLQSSRRISFNNNDTLHCIVDFLYVFLSHSRPSNSFPLVLISQNVQAQPHDLPSVSLVSERGGSLAMYCRPLSRLLSTTGLLSSNCLRNARWSSCDRNLAYLIGQLNCKMMSFICRCSWIKWKMTLHITLQY